MVPWMSEPRARVGVRGTGVPLRVEADGAPHVAIAIATRTGSTAFIPRIVRFCALKEGSSAGLPRLAEQLVAEAPAQPGFVSFRRPLSLDHQAPIRVFGRERPDDIGRRRDIDTRTQLTPRRECLGQKALAVQTAAVLIRHESTQRFI